MYSGGYPHSKFTLDAKNMHKSKAKSCGYYWRIIFLFSSLIQSLIIVSLVLFMVYGHPEQSSEEKRVQDLQQSFMKLTAENKDLQQSKDNLTHLLNITLTKKQKADQDLLKMHSLANVSRATILSLFNKAYSCELEKKTIPPATCTNFPTNANCGSSNTVAQLQAMLRLLNANFTQTVQHLSRELEVTSRARDGLRLETIALRRNASDLQRQLHAYARKCKGDFVQSLEGIGQVTRAFIGQIDGLFPKVLPFQLTCESQRDQLQQIRTNCSRLSHQVEEKFQRYLDSVGAQVSHIQGESSRLQVENLRLQEDWQVCERNRSAERERGARWRGEVQARHDGEVERLLKEQKKLREERELQRHTIAVQSSQISQLNTQILNLNTSLRHCTPKPSPPRVAWPPAYPFPGSVLPKPALTFPNAGTIRITQDRPRPGVPEAGVYTQPGATRQGSSVYSDVQKHLKELQEMANKQSGVSG